MNDIADSKYFSQRAKQISLLVEQTPAVLTHPTPPPSVATEVYFPFSNRTYIPSKETATTISEGARQQNIHVGRGRTTVPLSAFVLQKDIVVAPSPIPTLVVHDDVQFIRPRSGSGKNSSSNETQLSSSKREILLSALKQIDSGLKIL